MNDLAEQKLALLRDRFAQSLPQRLDAIENALDGDPAQLERLLHSLAGTSGTHGFAAISSLARLGEESYADRDNVRSVLEELRAAVPGQAEACPTLGSTHAPSVGQASACPGRILCLEDDPDQAAYVCAILESASHQTAVAHDAGEFERMIEQFRPDLLLLDVTLPDGNGIDLASTV